MRYSRLAASALALPFALSSCGDLTAPGTDPTTLVSVSRHAAPAATIKDVRPGEITLPGGVRLEYAETGKADGEPVILLHGYTDSWFSYSLVLPRLNPNLLGISISQRGHGDSDRPLSGYGDADFAADVDAFMEARGIERAVIVGHSMGSFFAQSFALRYPHRVKGLVLIGSATVAGNEGILGLRDFVQTLADPIDPAFIREFQASTIFHPVAPELLDAVVAESEKLPARVWKDALDGLIATENAARLGEIAVPTLIVWGDRDAIFPRAEQELLDAAIPNSTLLVYPETGHAPHWERPKEFTRDLETFIRRLD